MFCFFFRFIFCWVISIFFFSKILTSVSVISRIYIDFREVAHAEACAKTLSQIRLADGTPVVVSFFHPNKEALELPLGDRIGGAIPRSCGSEDDVPSRFVTVSGGSLECFAGSDGRLLATFERRFGPCTGLSSRTDYEIHFRSRLSAAACWMALAPSRIVTYRSTRAEIEEQMREAAELKRQQEAEVR